MSSVYKNRIIFGSLLFLAGVFVIGFGLISVIDNQIEENRIGYFKKSNDKYILEIYLDEGYGAIYIVSEAKGVPRSDRLSSLVVEVIANDNREVIVFEANGLKTSDCGHSYCKTQILSGLHVEKNGVYQLEISEISAVGKPEVVSLALHSNRDIHQILIYLFIGIVLGIYGLAKIILNLLRHVVTRVSSGLSKVSLKLLAQFHTTFSSRCARR